ncbi:MAG TPA: hypothetical protein VHV55_12130 [Pirellulales bacterium]|jgi:hypothetical protein|nr:hypothetical protein [Pirellulales bacterium]
MKRWILGALVTLAVGAVAAPAQAQIFGAGPVNGTGLGGYPGPGIPGAYGNYGGSGWFGGYGGSGLYGGFGGSSLYGGYGGGTYGGYGGSRVIGGYGFPGNRYGAYSTYSGRYGGTGYSRYGYPRYNNSSHSSAVTHSPPHKYKNYFDHSGDVSASTGSHASSPQQSLGRRMTKKAAITPGR